MKHQFIPKATAILFLGTMLAACGGGGTSTPTVASTAAPTILSGTAATGAPFSGAAVSIIDKTGAVVGSGTTGADGSYTITLSAGATAPFVLQAVRDEVTLVSVAPDTASSTVNITPITNLIASRLSVSGDPLKLAAELKANPTLLSTVQVNAKVDEIVAMLKPLLDAVGATANPLTGKFTADGTGSDRVLDSVSIKITPDSATTANIEVAIKGSGADNLIQFTNQTPVASVPKLATVDASTLVPNGTAVLIDDLLKRMTACFALPLAERVTANGSVAADVTAPACKTLFKNDNPGSFLHNGRVVAKTKAFSGLFGADGTGVTFARGSYDFTRPNGDLTISYETADSAGNNQSQGLAASRVTNTTTGKDELKIFGNQYVYDGGVSAYHQLREFINQPASNYYSTGYSFSIANNTNMSGVAKVEVVSPKGETITMVKSGSRSNFTIRNGGTASGSTVLRIRSDYAAASTAAAVSTRDTGQTFATANATDAEIASYPAQSLWTFRYFVTGNATTTPDVTQTYKTRSRALSIAELKQKVLANLTSTAIAETLASSTNGYVTVGGDAAANVDWEVPAGAMAPTEIKVFGRTAAPPAAGTGFDDSATVRSTVRSAAVPCSNQTGSDAHCTTTAPVAFAAGAVLNGANLVARDLGAREFSHFYAFYTLP
ncbi:MAG: hypothetical protein JWQ21_544 [Herminiimonas sp.]|nr:hypothetical protein [Herminiimonas sp.]